MKCPTCGEPLFALLYTMVCHRGCDRAQKGPYCPECGSNNTEKFDASGILDCLAGDDEVRNSETWHCWPCGEVWNIERQKPETD